MSILLKQLGLHLTLRRANPLSPVLERRSVGPELRQRHRTPPTPALKCRQSRSNSLTSSLPLELYPASPRSLWLASIPSRRMCGGSSPHASGGQTGLGPPPPWLVSSAPQRPSCHRFSERSRLRDDQGRPGKRPRAAPTPAAPAPPAAAAAADPQPAGPQPAAAIITSLLHNNSSACSSGLKRETRPGRRRSRRGRAQRNLALWEMEALSPEQTTPSLIQTITCKHIIVVIMLLLLLLLSLL